MKNKIKLCENNNTKKCDSTEYKRCICKEKEFNKELNRVRFCS